MQKSYILTLILATCLMSLLAQNTQPIAWRQKSGTFQKLHLHTDRSFYFIGDTLWFSAYLLDAKTHIPITTHQNLHIDLIDSKGEIKISQLYPIINGFANGSIPIADTSYLGDVVLRAYTNFQRNFGDEHFFYKSLCIDKTKSSIDIGFKDSVVTNHKLENIQVRFFPEGGMLLENRLNTVVVKISDEKGDGINTRGAVVDQNRNIVATFNTSYKGLGKFYFYPECSQNYTVIIGDLTLQNNKFLKAEKAGIKMQVIESNNNMLTINVISNSANFNNQVCTVACLNRGEVLFYRQMVLTKDGGLLKTDKSILGEGINRFVLLNSKLSPVSERLYFNKDIAMNTLQISIPKTEYSHRQPVTISFSLPHKTTAEDVHFSLAIVNENSMHAFGERQNMLSQLFLSSELKGTIQAPLDYFKDDIEISSDEKLDLLMLTQGWTRYIWNQIPDFEKEQFTYPYEAGIKVSGTVENLYGKKRVENSEVILFLKNDSLFTFVETTDKNGHFAFDHLYLNDSAQITLQARKSNQSENTEIILEDKTYTPPDFHLYRHKKLFLNKGIPINLYRQNYFARLRKKEFEPDKNAILIKEVEVKAHLIEKREVKFSQIYSKADYEITPEDGDFMHNNISEMLLHKAPAVFGALPPTSLFKQGGFTVYIDGIPCDPMMILGPKPRLSISNIDRIDVIKPTNPTGTALLGARGANGGIFVYTKRGVTDVIKEKYLKGVISTKVKGFSKYREFYSPNYTAQNIDLKKPDYRTTLYWNPSVDLKDGKSSLSFFTSDDIARYRVLVEGVSATGTIYLGTANFEVSPNKNGAIGER